MRYSIEYSSSKVLDSGAALVTSHDPSKCGNQFDAPSLFHYVLGGEQRQSINQSINQYVFNTTVTIAHGYNKF